MRHPLTIVSSKGRGSPLHTEESRLRGESWRGAKSELYDVYVTGHTRQSSRLPERGTIEAQFAAWGYFYGRALPSDRKARILDLGCGNGGFLIWLQALGFENLHGVDVSGEQIQEANRLGVDCVEQADAILFLEATEKWDLIVLRDVLEHFDREQALDLMKSIRRALRDGGRVLVQVPNGQGIHVGEVLFGDLTHELAYTRGSMGQLFRACGLSLEACYPVSPPPIGVKGMLRNAVWKVRVGWSRWWKWIETGSTAGIFTRNLIAIGRKDSKGLG